MIHETDRGVNRCTNISGIPDVCCLVVDILDNLVRIAIDRLQMVQHSRGQRNERFRRADDIQFI